MSNTPQIRFAGFTDAWEQRELRTAATFSKGSGYSKNDLKENGTPIILYGRLYTKYETVISEVDTFVDVQPNSVYSTGHEVIVPASGETAEDISRASFVAKSGILLGGDLNIIVPDDYINPVFLALTISNGNQQKELSKRAQGKSVVHIHNSDLENVVLLYPKYEEQEKIGEYFSKLDSLITLHQRKCDALQKFKKSMLQKMFPQNGESVPEIRFAGFTDAWEQRKLENITSLITKGTTPKDKSGNGEVNFIKVENIDPSSGIISSCSRISLEEHEGYLKRSQLKENDILFSIAGTLGRTSVVNKGILPANTNQALAILRVSEGDISYLVTVLSGRAVSDFIKKNPTVGAQPNLSLEQVSNLEIPYPSIEEQQKIGDYFRNLDDLITLHQRKLETLQKMKKSLLQKMFV